MKERNSRHPSVFLICRGIIFSIVLVFCGCNVSYSISDKVQPTSLTSEQRAKECEYQSWQKIELGEIGSFCLPLDMKPDEYAERIGPIPHVYVGHGLSVTAYFMPDPCSGIDDLEKLGSFKKSSVEIDNRRATKIVQRKDTLITICVPGIDKYNGLWFSVFCPECPRSKETSQTLDHIFDSISFAKN